MAPAINPDILPEFPATTASAANRTGRSGAIAFASPRHGVWRWPVFALLLAATGVVDATVVKSISETNSAIRVTEPGATTYWTDWSKTCSNVWDVNTECAFTGRPNPNPSTMLFSWGRLGDAGNSILEVTYTGTARVQLDKIVLASEESNLGPAEGPGISGLPKFAPPTGTGAMVVYEQVAGGATNRALENHRPSQQRAQVQLNGTVISNNLGQDYFGVLASVPDLPFYTTEGDPASPIFGIRQTPFSSEFMFADRIVDGGSVVPFFLDPGETLQLRFYESVWNNSSETPPALPDAYYGGMSVTLSTPAAIGADDLTIRARAGGGDETVALTVRNVSPSASTLIGTFDAVSDITDTTMGEALRAGAASAFVLQTDGSTGESAQRNFSFTPRAALGLDNAGSGQEPAALTVDQGIIWNDPNSTESTNRAVTAQTVGPIFALSESTTPAKYEPYGSTIELGSIDISAGELLKDLVLANVFGTNHGELTNLTLFNVAIIDDARNAFCIVSGSTCESSIGYGTILQAQGSTSGLQIRFNPNIADTFTATLRFSTDMNRAFGSAPGDGADLLTTFNLRGIGASDQPMPIPGTPLLFAAGLFGLLTLRRGRAGGRGEATTDPRA